MKTFNQLVDRKVAKALKPRNLVQLALKKNQGPKSAGPQGNKRGALRRAEKMAVAKELSLLETGR